MFSKSNFYVEFLSESNLILTQDDYGNGLNNILTPIRNYLQNKDQEVLSFALSRYSGANARLAFYSEWFFQTTRLTFDTQPLIEESKDFLLKKVPLSLKGVPNLYKIVEHDVFEFYLPRQLSFMQAKQRETEYDLVRKNPFLSKYLNSRFLSKVTASDVLSRQNVYSSKVSLGQFIEAQGTRSSFVQIGLPCLLGFLYNFNQSESPINPKGVKWVMIESLLKDISMLHQTGSSQDLSLFIHQDALDDKGRFKWFQLSRQDKVRAVSTNQSIREKYNEIREKVYRRAKNDLEHLVFPEKYRTMFKDLIDWAYAFKN